jgi:hypothetical protein
MPVWETIQFDRNVLELLYFVSYGQTLSVTNYLPCRWLLLLGRVGAAFIEPRLSLMILYIIFYTSFAFK